MNLLDVDFKTANWIVVAISLLIGLGYIAVMPRRDEGERRARTPRNSVYCSA